jgi:hypothetical protein
MRERVFIVVFTLIIYFDINAQEIKKEIVDDQRQSYFGVVLGYSRGEDLIGRGIMLGGTYEWVLMRDKVSAETGIIYHQKGRRVRSTGPRHDFLVFPIGVKFLREESKPIFPIFNIGIYQGLRIYSKNNNLDHRPYDLGLYYGIGFGMRAKNKDKLDILLRGSNGIIGVTKERTDRFGGFKWKRTYTIELVGNYLINKNKK